MAIDHVKYFREALQVAWESPDTSTQNGAVIVDTEGRIVGNGCNTFPHGVRITDERLERPTKYLFTEHAERNAIFDAGVPTPTDTMYALWAACSDCARAIIQSGIRTLYTHSFYTGPDTTTEGRNDWNPSISAAMDMFAEAGVRVVFLDAKIMRPGESLLYNGDPVVY